MAKGISKYGRISFASKPTAYSVVPSETAAIKSKIPVNSPRRIWSNCLVDKDCVNDLKNKINLLKVGVFFLNDDNYILFHVHFKNV